MSHQRFDGTSVRKDFLPFYGWEEAPLKGLEEAVKNVAVPRISDYAGAAADYADDYLRRNGGTDPLGLNREEIAAVNLYSKQNILHPEKSFYAVMNRTFDERDRKKLVPFFPYLRLIFNAVSHSKNACPRTLLRGFPNRQANWQEEYKPGEVVYWWGFSSTTKDSAVLESDSFFGSAGDRTLFSVDCIAGMDIFPYSDYPRRRSSTDAWLQV